MCTAVYMFGLFMQHWHVLIIYYDYVPLYVTKTKNMAKKTLFYGHVLRLGYMTKYSQ